MQKKYENSLQTTLKKSIFFSGTGLHSGKLSRITLDPAPVNTGIIFTVLDGNKKSLASVRASFQNVTTTILATTLQCGAYTISTVEHLLSALYGLGIDNVELSVFGNEIPILDGSALDFAKKIVQAGIVFQPSSRTYIELLQTVEVQEGDKVARVMPADALSIEAMIHWDHPMIGTQSFFYEHSPENFMEQIASARTFGFLDQVEMLKAKGLIQGASLESAVVLDDKQVLNPEGLRYPDEFVRHKILDALGDFSLSGFSFQGAFQLYKAGHGLHQKLLVKIFSNPAYYRISVKQPIDVLQDTLHLFPQKGSPVFSFI